MGTGSILAGVHMVCLFDCRLRFETQKIAGAHSENSIVLFKNVIGPNWLKLFSCMGS